MNTWVFDDGGREDAGYKGIAGDCVCRAFAIATEKPYDEIYALINSIGKSHKHKNGDCSSARNGVFKDDTRRVAEALGMRWIPTMTIGSGCKTHLKSDELPSGRIVCNCSKHCVAVIDGIVHDTYDSTREGTRCVYGYWVI